MPEPRMNCTIIKNGNIDESKILVSYNDAIYIKKLSESYCTGDFICKIDEAYIIKNGYITDRVYNHFLKDNALNVFHNIDLIGNNLELSKCLCNSNSGTIYVEHGAPTISFNNLMITDSM